jgi:transcriptional regulator with XRE-family HTH domain
MTTLALDTKIIYMAYKLKEARESAGYTIEDVARKLNIRKQYLVSLEEEDYDALPGKIYVEGYTKMYYEFLKLPLPNEENNIIVATKISGSEDTIEIASKYKKYIIFCSVILLVLVLVSFNLLKLQDKENYTTGLGYINDGNNEKIIDRPYQED